MKSQFFDQKVFSNLEGPMQKLIELNVRMMQNLSYMKPMDLLILKKPEDILEKQIEFFVQNSHMTLNYMRETFNILENHWLNVSHNMDQSTKKMVSETSSAVKKSTKKATASVKSAAKKVTSAAKKTSSSVKSAISAKSTSAKTTPSTAKKTVRKKM